MKNSLTRVEEDEGCRRRCGGMTALAEVDDFGHGAGGGDAELLDDAAAAAIGAERRIYILSVGKSSVTS